MIETTRQALPIITAMVLSFGLAACAGEPEVDADGAGDLSSAQATEAASGESIERAATEERDERREESGDERREEDGEEAAGDEHDGEEHDEEGEDSGRMIARTAVWDSADNGARLLLSYNAASDAFVGRVENMISDPLCNVRVEVHLSTGTELGPTEPMEVPYGGSTDMSLPAGGEEFTTWTAHAEVSICG